MVEKTFAKVADASNINGVYRISPIAYGDDKPSDVDANVDKYCIEDAIKATGHGKFHLLLLIVCGVGLMCVVVENVNIGFVLPYIRCEMDISTAEQGFLNSVGYMGIVLSSHLWGFLADTTGRRRVLLIAMSGSFTCALLSAFSFNVLTLILSRLFVGIFVSGVQAATYSYIGEFHSNETRTRALSFAAMFMPACFVYLPLLAWAIIPMQWEWNLFDIMTISPWRIYLLCSSLLNGLNLICLSQLPESPKFLLSMNRKEETLNVLRNMYSINTSHDKQSYPVKNLTADLTGTALSEVHGIYGILKLVWNQTWPLFQRPNVGNTFKLCFLMFVLFSIGHGTFMWYPYFLTQMQDYTDGSYTLCSIVGSGSVAAKSLFNGAELRYLASSENVTFSEIGDCNIDRSNTLSFRIILMMGVTFVTVSALISFYINKVDRKKLLMGWLLVCSGFSVSIALIPNFYVMAICFMVFLSCGLCAGIISAISVTVFPTNIRAMATCLILMFGRLGAVGGSNFVGLLLDGHCELIFYLYGALILSMLRNHESFVVRFQAIAFYLFLILGCTFVCYFLNTNPVEPSTLAKEKPKEIKCES